MMSECKHELICPKCNSDEVYYENANTGSGKYTCQDCEFMGNKEDFNYSIPVKDYDALQQQLTAKGTALNEVLRRYRKLDSETMRIINEALAGKGGNK